MGFSTSNIVQEYWPLEQQGDRENWSILRKVKEEIDKNGIVRPKGYNVSWHSQPEIEKHHFGHAHPMKPWRLTLAKALVMSYGMHSAMDTYVSRQATREELEDFHSADYLEYLKTAKVVLPDDEYPKPYNLGGSDCPIFEGLFSYCSMYSGASIDAARKLCNGESDIAINWSGGLHHAKKAESSGFCYVNDIVLAILQLLRKHPRVLYIDIDVHHGDGVEEAFWSTDRVMTLSIHKYDGLNFFPGTGDYDRTGPDNEENPGAHHLSMSRFRMELTMISMSGYSRRSSPSVWPTSNQRQSSYSVVRTHWPEIDSDDSTFRSKVMELALHSVNSLTYLYYLLVVEDILRETSQEHGLTKRALQSDATRL